MSRLVEREVTVEVDGDERDVPMRAWVEIGVFTASFGSEAEILVDGEWTAMSAADVERYSDDICEQAMQEAVAAHNDRDPGDFL